MKLNDKEREMEGNYERKGTPTPNQTAPSVLPGEALFFLIAEWRSIRNPFVFHHEMGKDINPAQVMETWNWLTY